MSFIGAEELAAPFDPALPAAPPLAPTVRFDRANLHEARRFVADRAVVAGLSSEAVEDLELAANEVVSNSVVHGGGSGTAKVWREQDAVVCEVRDEGCLTPPLVRRMHPDFHDESGRGLWLADQLCDLLQIRASKSGTVVRMLKRVQ